MPLENYPSAETPKPTPPPKSNTRSIITAILVIALLLTWGYIIWDKSKTQASLDSKDKEITTVVSQKDQLQSELNDATNRYDDLKTGSIKKDSMIEAQAKQIADTKVKIQNILAKKNATAEELAQAKEMIASLNQNIDSYKAQVDQLKAANTQLTVEKQAVTEQRDVAQKNFDSAKEVVKQREDVIDIGSTLHASNFNILGIDVKGNGKEKETENAKKVNKLRISFDLDENLITQSGTKELYVCISGPDGKAISVESLGSGSFTTRDGEQKAFTEKMDVNYIQAKRQTVSFDWKQDKTFIIGDYKIEVYNNGFKIGEGTVHLKKGGLFG